jgi:hypothetical protein
MSNGLTQFLNETKSQLNDLEDEAFSKITENDFGGLVCRKFGDYQNFLSEKFCHRKAIVSIIVTIIPNLEQTIPERESQREKLIIKEKHYVSTTFIAGLKYFNIHLYTHSVHYRSNKNIFVIYLKCLFSRPNSDKCKCKTSFSVVFQKNFELTYENLDELFKSIPSKMKSCLR